ncbi:alpha/beta fold hydrolase [Nonomuraea sp. NPDC051191]|uniref:alpha/beta fold hydrolase n=1 Tax=Nonomuraea sp. NPDC051191 TaxID=3364372 RepID=UPI0037A51E75
MRSFTGIVAGAAVLVLSPVAGLAALAGTAMVGARPGVFTGTGLAVFASLFFLGLLLCVPRPGPAWGRWLRAALILAVEAAVVWQVAGATLTPPPVPVAAGPPVAGQREWRLATGSRLAYVRVAPKRVTRPEPVVFLSGGAGVADVATDPAFYRRLATDGYEVYVYDQVGTGRSARLPDPAAYGLGRDVADLEQVRQAIGARRLNLVARGGGARLAAAYLSAHPDGVARAVLASPAGLDQVRSASLLDDGPPGPRLLAVYTLLRVEPAAAHAFAGDAELDARTVATAGSGDDTAAPCPPPPPLPASPRTASLPAAADGSGGYASLVERPSPPGLREGLARVTAPVLVVKGPCDGESWSAATDVRRAIPGSGFAYAEGRAAYLGTVRAFLADRAVPPYEAAAPPPGYLGPW